MKTIAIIPNYNEKREIIQDVINRTRKYVDKVLVIDDGSKEKIKVKNCEFLINEQNMGKGFTLLRGFKYASENNFDVAITLDSDGEHNPDEIPLFLEKIKECEFAVGQRFSYRSKERKFVNWFANFWFTLIIPNIKDMYCGFRAIKLKALKKMNIKGSRFELEPEMLLEAVKNNISIGFVKIQIKEAEKSHFKIRDYLRTNELFDRWLLKNHKFIKVNFIKKLILLIFAFMGLILTKILKWILQLS